MLLCDFSRLSAASVRTFVSSPHVPMWCPSVAFGCSVSKVKRQQTMLSFFSSNKRSRRVAGKLYNNFRGKQNKAYVLAMKKQAIARNTRFVVDRSTFVLPIDCIANTWGQSHPCLHREILLETYSRQRFKRSLENSILQQCKSSGLETKIT